MYSKSDTMSKILYYLLLAAGSERIITVASPTQTVALPSEVRHYALAIRYLGATFGRRATKPWQYLYLSPDSQGHRSLRPTFGATLRR